MIKIIKEQRRKKSPNLSGQKKSPNLSGSGMISGGVWTIAVVGGSSPHKKLVV